MNLCSIHRPPNIDINCEICNPYIRERDALRSRLELAEAVCRAANHFWTPHVGEHVRRVTINTLPEHARNLSDALTAWESAQPKEPTE